MSKPQSHKAAGSSTDALVKDAGSSTDVLVKAIADESLQLVADDVPDTVCPKTAGMKGAEYGIESSSKLMHHMTSCVT